MPQSQDLVPFTRKVLIVLALVVLLVLAWALLPVFMLVFGAVVVAALFLSLAHLLQRLVPVGDGLALAIVLILLGGGLALLLWLFGAQVSGEMSKLTEALPGAYAQFEQWLDGTSLGAFVSDQLETLRDSMGRIVSSAGAIAITVSGGVVDMFLVLVGAIYIAAQPQMYRNGLLLLVPPSARAVAGDALSASAAALRLWLGGQLVAMLAVGLLTGLGLWLLGVPAPFALGLIAFLLDFVPIVGPIAAAIPGILLGFTVSPQIGLATAALYLVIQQIEGNLLQPLIQQRAVELPPAVLLFSLVIFGSLQGTVGLLLAAPLTVVLYVLVKQLYVRETLGTEVSVPGEDR
ncbi:AI-2E family transporter [Luteimonas chenhongjianii]|uniref:AI-2E family transporter n=1 Tax=Luteimonas chenhongjianii TaxID=2006110 RepID=A0A290XFG0_9GAMM|nr:AI-2E family transporter [Luteimonas chenhongjianii]ATD67803.1 AI-2E family transporter [Luteimonas chenhongjianii]